MKDLNFKPKLKQINDIKNDFEDIRNEVQSNETSADECEQPRKNGFGFMEN